MEKIFQYIHFLSIFNAPINVKVQHYFRSFITVQRHKVNIMLKEYPIWACRKN